MKIAVFIDDQGKTASLYQPGRIWLYESAPSGWRVVREIPFALDLQMRLAEIRNLTLAMLADLEGCRHFVARSINGALLSYFDGMGVVMWKLEGEPLAFLPQIQHIVEEKARQQQEQTAPALFIKPGDMAGDYQLDLIGALRSDKALTSKQVLQPFLRQGEFKQIEIICDHLPKWFSRELPALNLSLAVETQPDGRCLAVIRHH